MSEIRKNPVTGEYIFIAAKRDSRPHHITEDGQSLGLCPFCSENHMTEMPILESADGSLRIVANKYPIIYEESTPIPGIHDVIIDTDKHDQRIESYSGKHLMNLLDLFKKRQDMLVNGENIKYIQLFKNQGRNAGASIYHSHWQMMAVPFVPELQSRIYKNAIRHYNEHRECLFCSIVDDLQNKTKELVIFENEFFISFCPNAPKCNYEIWIAPKKHVYRFRDLHERMLVHLAEVLKKSILALNLIIENVSYNIAFQDPLLNPIDNDFENAFHFFVQIIPRGARFGGLELVTNSYVNTTAPDVAAKQMRGKLS